jgi:hypothetical protein
MAVLDFGSDDDPTKSGDDRILHRARKRFLRCKEYYGDAYKNSLDDTKFALQDDRNHYGWPDNIYKARTAPGKNKPCLTINIVEPHNRLVINEAMQNKISIRVRATGGDATAEAGEGMQALVERTENISSAMIAYRNAIENQINGGFGWLYLETQFIGPKSFDQDIYIRHAEDPRAVFKDPDTKEPDGSDAGFGFIFNKMSRDKFNREHPKFKNRVGMSALGDDVLWVTDKHVLVATYYERTGKNDELIHYTLPDGTEFTGHRSQMEADSSPELVDAVIAQIDSGEIDGQYRDVITQDVNWYLIGGDCILKRGDKPSTRWIGEYVPIIPCYGRMSVIEGKMDCKGLTRAQISPQQMLNYNAPLALDTPLPTPSGWTTMRAVKAGDKLLDEYGKPCTVIGTSNVHLGRKCYNVTFSDGTSIIADEEHLWKVEERGKRISSGQNWSTKTIKTGQFQPKVHFIKVAQPLELSDCEFPIAPYVLGLWLGDGTSKTAEITAGIQDLEEEMRLVANTGHHVGPARHYNDGTVGVFTIHGIRSSLGKLGLLRNKHVPSEYLRASHTQRMALLQGLMDSDGCYAAPTNQCVFINGNERIVDGIKELLRTLGLSAQVAIQPEKTAIFPNGKQYTSKPNYRVSFSSTPDIQVFGLERKRAAQENCKSAIQWRRTKRFGIVSIEETTSVPVKCVTIDTPSHLFLAGAGMIPTHNSGSVQFGALQSKTPYIGPSRAFESNDEMWANANNEDYAFLAYDDWVQEEGEEGRPVAKPERQEPPQTAPVFMQGMQDAERWAMMATGQFQSKMGEEDQQAAASGKAINARNRQGDVATQDFAEHQADMFRLLGKMLIGIYPKLYDTKRVLHIEGEDLTKRVITIDPDAEEAFKKTKKETETAEEIIFNPNVGEYEVVSDPGPNFATQRQQSWEAMTQIIAQNQALTDVIGDLAVKNGDFAGAQEMGERLKANIKHDKPWLFDDGSNPTLQALQTQFAAAQKLNGELLTKLADMQIKLRGRDERRDIDAFKAESERMKVIIEAAVEHALSLQKAEHELQTQANQHIFNTIEQNNAAIIDSQNQPGPGEQ